MDSLKLHHLRLYHLLALAASALRVFVLPLTLAVSSQAFANLPSSVSYTSPSLWVLGDVYGPGTASEVCDAQVAASNAYEAAHGSRFTYSSAGVTGSGCFVSRSDGGRLIAHLDSAGGACVANSVYQSATNDCKCNTGYIESAGKCVTPPSECASKAGKSATGPGGMMEYPYQGKPPASLYFTPSTVCGDGGSCAATGTASYAGGLNGKYFVVYENLTYTGSQCSHGGGGEGASNTPGDPAPLPESERCAIGKCPGTVNGTHVCVPCGENTVARPAASTASSASTAADGSTTSSSSSGTGSTVTSCDGKTCTVTTTRAVTGVNAMGQPTTETGTTTETQTQDDFCTKNPKDKACSSDPNQGSFSGECAGAFKAVSDDAVINAMAEEQYRRNCTFFGNDTDSQSTANQARTGQDGKNTDKMKADAAASPVTIETFDQTGRGWGRSCPANPIIPLGFTSGNFEIPFSRICAPLNAFAIAGVALTMLGAFVWVLGGKK